MKRKAIQKLIEFEDFSDNDFEDYDDGQGKRRRRPLGDSEDEDENDVSREEEQRELKKAREMDAMEFHGNIFRDSFRKAVEDGGSMQSRDRPRSSEMRRTRERPERADEEVFDDDFA